MILNYEISIYQINREYRNERKSKHFRTSKCLDTLHPKFGQNTSLKICKLEHLLKLEPIDLTILDSAPPILSYEIVKHGVLLFKQSEQIKVDFETRVIRNYLDFKYYNDQFNSVYLNSLKVNGVL